MVNLKGNKAIMISVAVVLVLIILSVITYLFVINTFVNKTNSIKEQAKLAGLDTNVRIAMSLAEPLNNNYTHDNNGLSKLEKDLAVKLEGFGAENPFTKSNKVASTPLDSASPSQAAFAYAAESNEIEDAKYDEETKPDKNYTGVIKYDSFLKDGHIYIKFTSIGTNGLPIEEPKTVEILN
ncbi:MAG: hypothetical protein ACM3UU_06550 [Ignavibacteriales bacterium]